MATILAAHSMYGWGDGYWYTIKNKPKWTKLVYGFTTAESYPPDLRILGRVVLNPEFEPVGCLERGENPVAIAEQNYNNNIRQHVLNSPRIEYWETGNEPVVNSLDAMRVLSVYTIRMIQLLQADGKKPVIGNFSVGTPELPENDRYALWREYLPALKACYAAGGYLGLHEYSNNNPNWNTWLQFRYKWVIKFLDQNNLSGLRILLTEFGYDNLPDGGKPWKELFKGDADLFVRNLAAYALEVQWDYPRVEAAFYFTFGDNDMWSDFNVDNINFPELWARYGPIINEIPTEPYEDLEKFSAFILPEKLDFVANGSPINLYKITNGVPVFYRQLKNPTHIVNIIGRKTFGDTEYWQVTASLWIKRRKLLA